MRWFKDPVFSVSYPSGPVVSFSGHEFRLKGLDFVRGHFDEHSRIRLNEAEVVPVVFEEGSKVALKNTIPVMIGTNGFTKGLTIAPLSFRKLDIGGLRSLDTEFDRHLAPGFSDAQFWQAFDAAASDAG